MPSKAHPTTGAFDGRQPKGLRWPGWGNHQLRSGESEGGEGSPAAASSSPYLSGAPRSALAARPGARRGKGGRAPPHPSSPAPCVHRQQGDQPAGAPSTKPSTNTSLISKVVSSYTASAPTAQGPLEAHFEVQLLQLHHPKLSPAFAAHEKLQ